MANDVLWRDFPDINRKVAFLCNVGILPSSKVQVGCHCGSIGTVSLLFGNKYHAACLGRHIEVLDTSKEEPFHYRTDRYGYYHHPKQEEEENKVLKYLKDKNIGVEYFGDEYYCCIIHRTRHIPIWVISDVINDESPVRKEIVEDTSYNAKLIKYGSTKEFVKYLIQNKIGHIMESPIIQNPNHRTPEKYSLNQVWLWTHPAHINRAIPVAKIYPGKDKFPTKEEWIKTVGEDLKMSGKAPETIISKVFNDGRFPVTERTKHSLRGSDGRFIKEA